MSKKPSITILSAGPYVKKLTKLGADVEYVSMKYGNQYTEGFLRNNQMYFLDLNTNLLFKKLFKK